MEGTFSSGYESGSLNECMTCLPSLSVILILTVLSALGTVMLGVVLEILNSKAWGPSTSLSSMIVIFIHDTSITDELGENESESSGMVS